MPLKLRIWYLEGSLGVSRYIYIRKVC